MCFISFGLYFYLFLLNKLVKVLISCSPILAAIYSRIPAITLVTNDAGSMFFSKSYNNHSFFCGIAPSFYLNARTYPSVSLFANDS